MNSICSITPTICNLLGIEPPAASDAEVLGEVTGGSRSPSPGAVTRCLVFSPDAIGTVLVRKYASLFGPVRQSAPIEVGLRSVIPPKTPVCYASMFTGAQPAVHGITKYVKRAPACETLFDVLAREGLSTAVAAVKDSSMDMIFRGAGVDQFTEAYDELAHCYQEVGNATGAAYANGMVDYCNERYEQALGNLEAAVAGGPQFAEAHLGLAMTYEKVGQPQDAIEAYEAVLALDPDNTLAGARLNQLREQ